MNHVYCPLCGRIHEVTKIFVRECIELENHRIYYQKAYYECCDNEYLFENEELHLENMNTKEEYIKNALR